MAKTTSVPNEWLKQVDPELLKLDEIPLFGYSPSFPWEEYSQILSKTFEIDSLEVFSGEWEWKKARSVFTGIPKPHLSFPIQISAIEGEINFVMPQKDLEEFLSLLLDQKDPKTIPDLDEELRESFMRFVAIEALSALSECEWDKTATPHLQPEEEGYKKDALCLDIHVNSKTFKTTGRLLLSPSFQKSWKARWGTRSSESTIPLPLAEKLPVVIHLEAGVTTLSQDEWKDLKSGDVVLLDHCTLDPSTHQGEVILKVGGNRLFRASLEQHKMKILNQS